MIQSGFKAFQALCSHISNSTCTSYIKERRQAAVEAAHARLNAEREALKKEKEAADKAYLEKQWEIEQNRRKTIESRQDAEMAEERKRIEVGAAVCKL